MTELASPAQQTCTIKCTEQNAKAFQAMVKSTPELLGLVQHLQGQGLFPGLRAMSMTVTGTPDTVAKGLSAWADIYKSSQRTS